MIKVISRVLLSAILLMFLAGCGQSDQPAKPAQPSKTEHPTAEQVKPEHPKAEHPKAEQPKPEHPQPGQPKPEHPK